MLGLEPLPLFPCPALSLARCFRGDHGGHSSSWLSYFGSLILDYYLVKVKKNSSNVLLLAQVTCLASFGPVFLVVAANVGGGRHVWTCRDGGSGNGRGGRGPPSLRFFVTSSLVSSYNL